jgi:hypothetical protein
MHFFLEERHSKQIDLGRLCGDRRLSSCASRIGTNGPGERKSEYLGQVERAYHNIPYYIYRIFSLLGN